jgi:type IV secretory pathway VirB2 component (pilin)
MKKLFVKKAAIVFVLGFILSHLVFADTSTGMPWEDPLSKIQSSLQGPTAKAIGIIVLIAAAITIMATKGQSLSWLFWIIGGLALIFNAVAFMDLLFPNASGFILP